MDATLPPTLKSSDNQLGILSFPQRESVCPHSEVLSPPVPGKKLPRGLVLIFNIYIYLLTRLPGQPVEEATEKIHRKKKTRTTNYWLQTQMFEEIIRLPWPPARSPLGSPSSSVVLFFFNKVARKPPGNTPPAVSAQVHRTMASHTCVNFSVFTVLRMM